ncbi:MAG: T9SS type A sorting domain-containing protein [Chitinophagales bacterium]
MNIFYLKRCFLAFAMAFLCLPFCFINAQTGETCETGNFPPSNDNCNTPYSLGVLPNPMSSDCQSNDGLALGTAISISSSNICATADASYNTIVNCEYGTQAEFAADVWYSFVATGNYLGVQVISEGDLLQIPNISLYEYNGSCSNLIARKCVVGALGTATLEEEAVTIGQTYYLQISGTDINDQCDFTLSLRSGYNCSFCLLESSIDFSNIEPSNNTFNCGETINICYTIEKYSSNTNGWLHGIAPIFGDGWDFPNSFVAGNMPNSCDEDGEWNTYMSVTSSSNNLTYGPGWFYDNTQPFTTVDNNPGNNYGDENVGNCNWEFCFQINTLPCDMATDGMDLSIEFEHYSDGESGSYNMSFCENDPNFIFEATLVNCLSSSNLIFTTDDSSCNPNDAYAIVNITGGTPPYTYLWNTGQTTAVITNLSTGTYVITITDAANCVLVDEINIVDKMQPEITNIQQINNTTNVILNPTVANGTIYEWTFQETANDMPQSIATSAIIVATQNGIYTLTVSNVDGCFVSEEIIINNIGLSCPFPTNRTETFDINGPNTLRLSWNGNNEATSYEIAGRKVGGNGSWLFWNTTNTYREFSGINNGTYEWSVRAICDTENSDWLTPAQQFIYNSTGKTNLPNPFDTENTTTLSHLNIYPNPATSQITLQYEQNIAEKEVQITIFDMLGKKILEQTKDANLGKNSILIDISNLSKACYFVKIDNGVEQITRKLMVF